MTERENLFNHLFNDNHQAVLGYLVRRVQQPDDATDLLADVFLVAWRRLDEVPRGDEARLWLFGVARKSLLNHRRRMFRRRNLGEKLSQHSPPATAPRLDVVVDDDLRRALRRLSVRDRELLTLTAWEGLSPEQIGEMLNVSAGTARVRLHRARKRLRKLLDANARVECASMRNSQA